MSVLSKGSTFVNNHAAILAKGASQIEPIAEEPVRV